MKYHKWTNDQDELIKSMVGSFTYREMAEKLGVGRNSVAWRAKRLGLSNVGVHRKHFHLREQALIYYQDHSFAEVCEQFSLTKSQFKSLLTVAYRDPKLVHLRKDTRRNDVWSLKEKITLLRLAGVQPREKIAKKLNRGGVHSVKEELKRLGIGSKFLNGCPVKWIEIVCPWVLDRVSPIKTQAGPTGGARADFRFRIVPWVTLHNVLCRRKSIDPLFCRYVRLMAKYQKFLWNNRSAASIERSIRRYVCQR